MCDILPQFSTVRDASQYKLVSRWGL